MISKTFANRRQELQQRLRHEGIHTLVVTHPPDWYYLTGFTGESGALVISSAGSRNAVLLTDGRFVEHAAGETSGVKIVQQAGGLYPALGKLLRALPGRKLPSPSCR